MISDTAWINGDVLEHLMNFRVRLGQIIFKVKWKKITKSINANFIFVHL
jgi:hypothetical protein